MTFRQQQLLPRATRRLTLRALREADLPVFQSYRHDPLVGQYQSWTPLDDVQALDFLREMNAAPPLRPGEWYQLAIADRTTDELMGDLGVLVAAGGEHAEVGFTIRPQSQRLGVGSEAVGAIIALLFEVTGVDAVIGITDARNIASRRLLERAGLRKSEVRQSAFRGETCTEYVYVRLRDGGA